MMAIEVMLFLIVIFPGQQPIEYSAKIDSVPHCMRQITEFAENPPKAVIDAGGKILVSCVIEIPPTVEH